jgi:diguanylate cyclase (GGDEF)-like protein
LTSTQPPLALAPTDAKPTPTSLLTRAEWNLYIDGPRCGEFGRQILALTDAQPEHPARAEAWWHIAFCAMRYGDPNEGVAANARAREAFTAFENERGLLLCDEVEIFHARIQQRLDDAFLLHERIAARTDVQRTPTDLYISQNSRAITRKLLLQTDDMLRDFYRAHTVAHTCESPGPRLMALVNLGGVHADLYNLVEAQALSAEGLDLAEAAGAWVAFAVAGLNLLVVYEGLGDIERCRAVLARLLAREGRLPPQTLRRHAQCLAMACLAVGDLVGARRWLDEAISNQAGLGDAKSDFARVSAGWLMAHGRHAEARAVIEERLACCNGVQDQPYPRMRLLQTATNACEQLGDPWAALRYLHESHTLHEALVGRTVRARFIALEAAHEVETTRQERDRARAAADAAEHDRQRLAALNDALENKVAEAETLQRQLREQALRDPLTGLYNRRFLSEAGASRIELANRNCTPLCVALIDIDHFKQVNDKYGHEAGDQVLVVFASLLHQRLRRSDIVCRFGGEEFLLLVDPCTEDAVRLLLDELLDKFRAVAFSTGRDEFTGRTFSAGVAVLAEDAADFEALVKIADDRMYRAKSTGRARVCGREG